MMTDKEIDAIIQSIWNPETSLQGNLKAIVRVAALYGWRCAQVAHWAKKFSSYQK